MNNESQLETEQVNHEIYGKGCLLFEQGSYRDAISCFREALEYWPEDPEAWLALGNSYGACGKARKAEGSYRKSLEFQTDKTRDATLFNLGNVLVDQDKLSEAVECYEQVSPSSSMYPSVRINIEKVKTKLSQR